MKRSVVATQHLHQDVTCFVRTGGLFTGIGTNRTAAKRTNVPLPLLFLLLHRSTRPLFFIFRRRSTKARDISLLADEARRASYRDPLE